MLTEAKKLERQNVEISFSDIEEIDESLLRKVIARNLLSSWQNKTSVLVPSIHGYPYRPQSSTNNSAALVGAATGGAMGAGVGFLAKHNPLTGDIAKTADKSLKTLGRNKSIQKFEEKHGKGVLQEVETYKNMTEDAKRSRVNANIG